MPPRPASSIALRLLKYALLAVASSLFIIAASFRLQSYFFARKVHSVLTQREQIQRDKTAEEEVHTLLPDLRQGILFEPYGLFPA